MSCRAARSSRSRPPAAASRPATSTRLSAGRRSPTAPRATRTSSRRAWRSCRRRSGGTASRGWAPTRLAPAHCSTRTVLGARSACSTRGWRCTSPANGPERGNGFRKPPIARLCRRRCSRRSASLSWRSWRPTRATPTGRASLPREQSAQVDRCGLDRCPMMALVIAVSAAVRAEQGRADEARGDLRHALELLGEIVDPSPWYEVECRILLARATLRLNGLTAARELLAVAAGPLSRTPDADVLDRMARGGPSRGRPRSRLHRRNGLVAHDRRTARAPLPAEPPVVSRDRRASFRLAQHGQDPRTRDLPKAGSLMPRQRGRPRSGCGSNRRRRRRGGGMTEVEDTEPQADSTPGRAHRKLGLALIVVASLLTFLAIFAVWANRQLLNTDNWTDTSTELLENDAIRTQIGAFLVEALYANVDVKGELEEVFEQVLQPAGASTLAGPAASGLRSLADQRVDVLLERPRVQQLWEAANRRAHLRLLEIIEGGGDTLSTSDGDVTLNLSSLLSQTQSNLGVGGRVEEKLPESAAQIVLFHSDQLDAAQKGVKLLKSLAIALVALALILFGLAVYLARGWRREALRACGIGFIFAAAAALVARSVARGRGGGRPCDHRGRASGGRGLVEHRHLAARAGGHGNPHLRRRGRLRGLARGSDRLGSGDAPRPRALPARAALRVGRVRRDRPRADRLGAHPGLPPRHSRADPDRPAGGGYGGAAPSDDARVPRRRPSRMPPSAWASGWPAWAGEAAADPRRAPTRASISSNASVKCATAVCSTLPSTRPRRPGSLPRSRGPPDVPLERVRGAAAADGRAALSHQARADRREPALAHGRRDHERRRLRGGLVRRGRPHRSRPATAASTRRGTTPTCASWRTTSRLRCFSRTSGPQSAAQSSRPTAIPFATAVGCSSTTA